MANNKNQHFVPRCYLRPFTQGAEGLAISLFNLERKKLISNAPVKNQCSRDYFYGKDQQLEDKIQLIESDYSQALRDLIKNTCTFSEENKAVFRTFWIFQHLRTETAAISTVKMAEEVINIADIPSEKFSLSINEAVQTACRIFTRSKHELNDLKFCIMKNKTAFPFLTSDNPAILTNKWHLENKRTRALSFSLQSAGTLVILPLTPKLLLLGYDGNVYNVPNERGVVQVKNIHDVIAFNRHQFLQCTSNIYVHDSTHEEALAKYYSEIAMARPKSRHIVHYTENNGITNDKTLGEIINIQIVHPNPGFWPSQIKIRPKGSVYTNGTGIGYVRAPGVFTASGHNFKKEKP